MEDLPGMCLKFFLQGRNLIGHFTVTSSRNADCHRSGVINSPILVGCINQSVNKIFWLIRLHHFVDFIQAQPYWLCHLNILLTGLPGKHLFAKIHFKINVLPHATREGMHVVLRHIVRSIRTMLFDKFIPKCDIGEILFKPEPSLYKIDESPTCEKRQRSASNRIAEKVVPIPFSPPTK